MDNITGKGWIAGIITWVTIMWYQSKQGACLRTHSCDGGDLFLFAIIGIVMLGPSWLVAMLVSNIWNK